MANRPKKGLDYFPMDVSVFDDIKIRKLIKYQGGQSFSVYAYLLCNIYNEGYYIKWDNELPFVISEKTGLNEAYIQEVIKCCFTVGVFSKKMFDQSKVITSRGIQERYSEISKQAKRKFQIDEFNLINSEEIDESSEDMPNSSELLPKSPEELPQSKVKEIKEKESKGKGANALVAADAAPKAPTRDDYKKIVQEYTGKDLVTVVSVMKGFLKLRPEFVEPYKDYWNIAIEKSSIPKVQAVSDARLRKLKTRMQEPAFDFIEIVKKIRESRKLMADSSWFSFDWVFENQTNYIKILEGNYDN